MNCDICSSVEWMRFSLCFLWLCSTVGASPEHLSRLFSTMRCQAVVLFWTLRVRHISFVFWMELYLFTDFFFSQHFFLSFLLFNQYNLLLLKIAIHHIHKWVDKIKCKYTVNSASSSQHSNRMNKERKWSTNLSRSISIGEWLWLCGKLVCNFRHHLLVCFYDGAFLLCAVRSSSIWHFLSIFFVRGSIIQKYMQKSVLYGKEFDGKLLRYKIPTMFLLIPQQPTLNCVFFVFLFILNFVCVCHWRNWLKPVVVNCAFRITFIADERFQAYFKDTTKEWILQIKYVQARDAGVYECQVSTEPKVSARAELHVVGEYSKIYDWKIHCEWIQSFHYLDIFDCCLCLG